MNIENRRLREIQTAKRIYQKRLDESTKIGECLIYQGKIECLNREERQILERNDVL